LSGQVGTAGEYPGFPIMFTAFVSYRRKDSRHITDRIYDRLVGSFGKDSVFREFFRWTYRVHEQFLSSLNMAPAAGNSLSQCLSLVSFEPWLG
jgi:hypothetical protein